MYLIKSKAGAEGRCNRTCANIPYAVASTFEQVRVWPGRKQTKMAYLATENLTHSGKDFFYKKMYIHRFA